MRIFLRVFGKKAMPFTPCRVYIGTEAGGETHRFRTGWKAHTERNAAAKDGSDEMPVSMQAEQTITQFLELLAAFRLKEAGELVFEDIWYDIPGTDWLEGRAGLEILAAYLRAELPEGWKQEAPVRRSLGADLEEIRVVTGLPGRRLRWTAVTGKGPAGWRIRSIRVALADGAEMWDRVPFGLQKCRLDDACTCLYLSDAFLRMVGYTRQEIRELFEDSFYRLLPPDDAARVRRSVNEALDAGESSLELEYRLQTKDGGYIWVLDRTEVLGEDGTAYAYCVISDITPQHTLKAYYENILDCLPTPLIVTDRRNRLRLLNNSALHLIGKPAGELLGRNSDTLYQGDKPSYVERDGRCYKVDYSHLYDADGREDAHIAVMSDITALREMDDSLKSLAKKIPGGVCEVAFDEDFTLLYGNEGFYAMYGYTPAEMREELGNRLILAIHPEDVPHIRQEVAEAGEQNRGFEFEKRIYRKDGTMVCMLTRGTISRRQSGLVLDCLILDITARKNMEQELRLSEERFRIALAQTTDIVFDYDMRRGEVLHTNRSVAVYGLPQIVAGAPQAIVDSGAVQPDSAEVFLDMYRRIDAGEQTASCIIGARHADGKPVWNRITMTNVYGTDGRPFRAVGIIEDITAQREAERRFAEEEQFRAAMLSKAITSYEVNVSQNRLIRGFENEDTWFGVELTEDFEELMRRLADKAVHPEDREAFLRVQDCRRLLDAFENGVRECTAEYRRRESDGRYIWASCVIHLLKEAVTGELKGFAYVTDIDDQKKHELSLQYSAERDLLTGLYNRHTAERLIRELLQAGEKDALHAFLMIDLDDFKAVNDTLGHIFGDAVLSEIAKKIRGIFRKSDIVGRIGGDEFVVFLRDIPQIEHAVAKAEELCREFRAAYAGENGTYKISGSIGIAYFPSDGVTFDELYGKADLALYAAKHKGKDACAVYRDVLPEHTGRPRPLDDIENTRAKNFSENVSEYVFRILYEAKDLQLAVESVLKLLCRHFGVSRGYIFENTADDQGCSNTFEWCDAGVEPQIDRLQNISYASLGGYEKNFARDDIYIVHSLDDVAEEERVVLEPQGIRSMLQCAIRIGGRFKGFMGVDECKQNRVFTFDEIETLRNVAGLLGTFLSNRRAEEAVRQTNRALRTVMDNLNSYTYVVRPGSYELLFINQKTLGVAPGTAAGDKCYRAFFGREEPCAACPMQDLREGVSQSRREIYNDLLDIWTETTASLVDWTDDERCCLLNCIDISEYKPQGK